MNRKQALLSVLCLASFSLFAGLPVLAHAGGRAAVPRPQATVSIMSPARVRAAYGHHPLSVEATSGQTDSRVKFLARGGGYILFLTERDVTLRLTAQSESTARVLSDPLHTADKNSTKTTTAVVRLKLAGSASPSQVEGLDLQPGSSNYFIGNNPALWRRDAPHYARVRYRDMYPA